MNRVLLALLIASGLVGCVPKGQYTRLQDTFEQERRQREQLESELEQARNNVKSLQDSLRQLQAARDKAISDLETELTRAQQSGSERAAALENALYTAKREREQQVSTLEEELERAREEARKRAEELEKLNATYTDLLEGLEQEIEQGRVTITNLKGKLTVNLIDKILFDSGSAELNSEGKLVLDKVSDVLKQVTGRHISVEGHTDDVPIARAAQDKFPSNWELSTARASTVVRYLVEKGVEAQNLSATGYSMYAPIAVNDSSDNRRLNRRIEIVLLPKLQPQQEGN